MDKEKKIDENNQTTQANEAKNKDDRNKGGMYMNESKGIQENDEQKEINEEKNKGESIEISEQELEDVSGGFITIIDTCKKHYDRGTCFRLDGLMICPQLNAVKGQTVTVDSNGGYFVYTMTCRKGLFSGVYEQINWHSAD